MVFTENMLGDLDEDGYGFSNEEKCLHKVDEDRFEFVDEEEMSS